MADLTSRWSALLVSGRAEWRAGMRWCVSWDDREHVTHLPTNGRIGCDCDPDPHAWSRPDWTDPATLGCLLGLVRERWGDPGACPVHQPAWDTEPARWCVAGLAHGGWRGEFAPTEAEALIAALEAAPEGA